MIMMTVLVISSLLINTLIDDVTNLLATLTAKFARPPSGCSRTDHYARIQTFSASQNSNNNLTNAF